MENNELNYKDSIIDMPLGTGKLAFRELPKILSNHVTGNNVLDYGCGFGRSTRFLKSIGFDVIGTDISESLLKSAKDSDPVGEYYLIEEFNKKHQETNFDLILLSFVLIELNNKDKIIELLSGLHKHCKKNTKICVISPSENLYKNNWYSLKPVKDNNNINSADAVSLYLKQFDTFIHDYYWTKKDYLDFFQSSGFIVEDIYSPKANDSDDIDWVTERKLAPFDIYVLSPKTS